MFSGCGKTLNPSLMFKVPKSFDYDVDQTIANTEYKIAPNDWVEFSVFTNDGFKLVDLTTSPQSLLGGGGGSGRNVGGTTYRVEVDGYIKLPIIGRVKIKDMTVRQAEKMLEHEYETYYNKPFVLLRVINRRVFVFPGGGGAGTVINLENENTSLIEGLALAGGIVETGKAYKVKLIRGDTRNPKVMLIDLSTVEGMRQSNLLLQANDIIYVEPRPLVTRKFLEEITPIVGIITSFFLIYNIVQNN